MVSPLRLSKTKGTDGIAYLSPFGIESGAKIKYARNTKNMGLQVLSLTSI